MLGMRVLSGSAATGRIYFHAYHCDLLTWIPCRAGEGGINGVGGVIASAIDDALAIPGGVTQLPMSPQRVKELLRRKTKVVSSNSAR
jgi:hypothetical protein